MNLTPTTYLDNGFSSAEGMAASHGVIIDIAMRLLHGQSGRILDLGCGNGRLVAEIAGRLPGITPCGVECVLEKANRGRATLERAGGHLHVGDIFSPERPWFDHQPYVLTILMIGRLLEVDRQRRLALIADVEHHSNLLLLYTYGDSLSLSDEAGKLLEHTFPNAVCIDDGAGSLPHLWVYTYKRVESGRA